MDENGLRIDVPGDETLKGFFANSILQESRLWMHAMPMLRHLAHSPEDQGAWEALHQQAIAGGFAAEAELLRNDSASAFRQNVARWREENGLRAFGEPKPPAIFTDPGDHYSDLWFADTVTPPTVVAAPHVAPAKKAEAVATLKGTTEELSNNAFLHPLLQRVAPEASVLRIEVHGESSKQHSAGVIFKNILSHLQQAAAPSPLPGIMRLHLVVEDSPIETVASSMDGIKDMVVALRDTHGLLPNLQYASLTNVVTFSAQKVPSVFRMDLPPKNHASSVQPTAQTPPPFYP